nr:hypothetical protein [Turneriella parva]
MIVATQGDPEQGGTPVALLAGVVDNSVGGWVSSTYVADAIGYVAVPDLQPTAFTVVVVTAETGAMIAMGEE